MTQPRQATYHYSIDRDDTLVSVGNTWLAFARDNEAPELTGERVLGESVWRFVNGPETRDVYELLFRWVRSRGARISVPFRCDSPGALRFMRLHLARSEADGVDMAAVVERVEPRKHLRLLERHAERADDSIETCGFCRRILVFGEWLEAEEAIARLGRLETEKPPQLRQVVCEPCARICHAQVGAPLSE